jgi:hypothetical protein
MAQDLAAGRHSVGYWCPCWRGLVHICISFAGGGVGCPFLRAVHSSHRQHIVLASMVELQDGSLGCLASFAFGK